MKNAELIFSSFYTTVVGFPAMRRPGNRMMNLEKRFRVNYMAFL
jgi:hypothetical protein